MKRIILFTLFSLLMSVVSFSQVQKNFFGATLGVSDINTTYYKMRDYFKQDPSELMGEFSVVEVNYASYSWDIVNVSFKNGKLATISLRCLDFSDKKSDEIYNRYYSLRNALKNKYDGNTQYGELSEDSQGRSKLYYFDGRYAVYLVLNFKIRNNKKIYHEVALYYQDELLLSQPEKNMINDEL